MHVLPRLNFCSYILPLAPPPKYWEKIHSIIARFLWKGRRPKIKLVNLQRKKELGGLSVPNFKLYSLALSLRPVINWFYENTSMSWIKIERNLVAPAALKDVLFTQLPISKCKSKYGEIISYAIENMRKIEKLYRWKAKWHASSALFYNSYLRSGGSHFILKQWFELVIHCLGNIMASSGLRSFQDLKESYSLPSNTFFLCLQLCSAIRAVGISIDQQPSVHPVVSLIKKLLPLPKAHVSLIYNTLLEQVKTPLILCQNGTRTVLSYP